MAVIVGRRGEADEPPLPVPRGLRPFLRFTRLPDRALTATRRVLDDDDEFRGAVRDATSEDVVGRAGWLFLDRPGGWEEELAELAAAAAEAAGEARGARSERETARRLAAVEESLGRAEAELARRVAELAEVKEQLAVERRARRRAESETGRLRKRVAGLEAELEEGRRQAADGRDLAAELHHLRQRCAELEAERRRAQEQVHQLEQEQSTGGSDGSGGAPPSGAVATGAGPPGDRVAEVEALVDAVTATVSTLADALATAARQLAPFAPSAPPIITAPTPGPARATPPSARASAAPSRPAPQPAELPPGVWDDSAEAADHLVRMEGVLVLVDGYNVTKLARPELSLPEQRRWLADAAAELAARTGARLELVFDGAGHGASAPADRDRRARVQVRYSPDGVEADDVVIDLVSELAGARPVVVASDDRRVQEGSRRGGANVITASQLLAVLRRR
ncbi:MAG: NYN domain-containing protein [Actinobacteria bacterium]|nr:NYN domain-containing protein [Actinomycetota bacterium]